MISRIMNWMMHLSAGDGKKYTLDNSTVMIQQLYTEELENTLLRDGRLGQGFKSTLIKIKFSDKYFIWVVSK